MPEPQLSAASGEVKPEKVMPKDVLKSTNLIIMLVASVLFILLGWYILVLKPTLSESIPMDIRPTKKPSSNTQFSQESTFKTKVETKLTDNDYERSNAALGNEEKSKVVQRNNPTRRTKSTLRNVSRKSLKSNIARNEKEPTAPSQDFSRLQKEYEEQDKKGINIRAAENMTVEEDKNEDTVQKIKSATIKLKESFLTHATQPICTQVQIAMNQCPN